MPTLYLSTLTLDQLEAMTLDELSGMGLEPPPVPVPEPVSASITTEGNLRIQFSQPATVDGLPVLGITGLDGEGDAFATIFVDALLSGNGTTVLIFSLATPLPDGANEVVLGLNNVTPTITGDGGAVESFSNFPVTVGGSGGMSDGLKLGFQLFI